MPLDKNVVKVIKQSLTEQTKKQTFSGYPPELGYNFLKDSIKNFYKENNVSLNNDDIFINNGACCDIGNILDIFDKPNVVIINPTYPAYSDTNMLVGNNITYLNEQNWLSFCKSKTNQNNKNYLIYLCSPNNPTGKTLTKKELSIWVNFANKTNSVIIFDVAYQMFIEDDSPLSIFQIKGASTCAIEIASFSKMAGFTNLRCGWTIIKPSLIVENANLNLLWQRRQNTKFNGVPKCIQKGASYVLTKQGLSFCKQNILYYKNNVKIIKDCLNKLNIKYLNSNNSPYVWFKCPNSYSSWEFFDLLLKNCNVVGVPGVGFGKEYDKYFRFSGFNSKTNTIKACNNMLKYFKHKK